mgnify:CR=1 FL=1
MANLESLKRPLSIPVQTPKQYVTPALRTNFEIQPLESQLAPIHRLVDDVLLGIFNFVVQIPPNRLIIVYMHRKHPASMLSCVCRRWRALTLSSPQLWTKVFINWMHQRQFQDIGRSPHSLLSLSGTLPLDVFIYGDHDEGNPGASSPSRIVSDALVSSVSRWKTAWVELPQHSNDPELWKVLQCSPASFAQLEALNISVDVDVPSGRTYGQPQPFDELPILHASSLRNLTLHRWEHRWGIPSSWENLREAKLDFVYVPALFALISACPNLSKVRAKVYDYEATADPRVPITDRPHEALTTLIIKYKYPSPISLLCIPPTPALKVLSIIIPKREDEDREEEDVRFSHASILRIAQGASQSLVHLTLHNSVFQESTLVQILQLLINLEHLDIDANSATLTSDVFRLLTPVSLLKSDTPQASKFGALCPTLSSLKFRIKGDDLARVDERIDASFSLIGGLIARGAASLHIFSDSWAIVQGSEHSMSLIPPWGLEEALIRQSKKDEIERRVWEMNDTLGVRGLRLEHQNEKWSWEREDLVHTDGALPDGLYLVGYVLAYDSP